MRREKASGYTLTKSAAKVVLGMQAREDYSRTFRIVNLHLNRPLSSIPLVSILACGCGVFLDHDEVHQDRIAVGSNAQFCRQRQT